MSYGGMNPPQSPDLNISEAVWDCVDRGWNKKQPTSKDELSTEQAWRTICEAYFKKLQESLSKRAQAAFLPLHPCFNKLWHLFPVFLHIYKEIRGV